MKQQDKINILLDIAQTSDTALSSIAGMITACLNDDELTDWQAKSILRCILSTASYYGGMNDKTLERLDD